MLKFNPIITGKISDTKGLQVRKPEFFASAPAFKPALKTDIFERQEKRDIDYKSYQLPFLGKQNRYEQGKEIASNLEKIIKRKAGAVSKDAFKT